MGEEFKKCKVEDCDRKTKALGYCDTHYKRFKLYGESLTLREEDRKPRKKILTIRDMSGEVFGNLTVLKRLNSEIDPNGTKRAIWLCDCTCGNQTEVRGADLRSGNTKSCGCIKGFHRHGMSYDRIYRIYVGIKQRCNNPKDTAHKNYYDKQISICEEWSDKKNGFLSFYNWSMENGYLENLTIDRIDYKGDYSPQNCRWVDMVTQANNRENNRLVTIKDETKTAMEWAKIIGITHSALTCRLDYGWNEEELLQPKGFKRATKKPLKKLMNNQLN